MGDRLIRGAASARGERTALPNFVVIGAMKAGTSSLWEYLKGHPQVFMCLPKEPSFFTEAGTWSRGRGWYESLFRGAGDAIAVGEASTTYTRHPTHSGVPARIASVIPGARLIYVVRDPIERIRSHYQYRTDRGLERRPLAEAVLEHPDYVDYSRYASQIDRCLDWFPKDRLLVVTSEDLRDDRKRTVGRVFRFLGVDPDWVSPGIDAHHNVTDRREPRPFARRLRRVVGYRRIARGVPPAVRSAYRRVARRKRGAGNGSDLIPADVRRELERRLAEDVMGLRPFLGDRFHGWGIA
ncbi:MAG: sulfotransferase family protein [Actinomycetota bacterium]